MELEFGRFDGVSREEKQKAYREFLIHKENKERCRQIWLSVACAAAVFILNVFVTFLITGHLKTEKAANNTASSDYIVGEYEAGDVEITFDNKSYWPICEGLHGGNQRMTRIYTDGKSDIALSWRYFTEAENLLTEQAPLTVGSFEIEEGLGEAVVMAILPAKRESEYIAVYAESGDLTARELLNIIDGKINVTCDWWIQYYPRAGGNIWTALTGINDITNPLLRTENGMDCSLGQTPGLTEEFSEGLLKIFKSSRWRAVREHGSKIEGSVVCFAEHYLISLGFYNDGTVAYSIKKYRSKLSPEDSEFFIWLLSEEGENTAAQIRELLSDTLDKCGSQNE
jgi:hypothetical protein